MEHWKVEPMRDFYFTPRFVSLILAGQKRATGRRKKKCAPGEKIAMYVDDKSKKDRRIATSTCLCVFEFHVSAEKISVNETLLHVQDYYGLATTLGFVTPKEMLDFYSQQYGLPFDGYLHTWGDLEDENINAL